MVRATVVVRFRPPEVPVMVMVNVPVAARRPTVSVSVLDVFAGFGLSEADTRLGKPEVERVTAPVKPPEGVMVIVDMPRAPRARFRLAGDAARLKFGPGVMVSETVVELTSEPEVPVMVI